MEGVGARLGRSSNRYGPTTVFTGPVRRWKKKWVHVAPPRSKDHHTSLISNGIANAGDLSAQLLFYKWTPQAKDASDGSIIDNSKSSKEDISDSEVDEPVKKKFKYIPVVVLEEQKNEFLEQIEDETIASESDVEQVSTSDGYNEKPDFNDAPMDVKQVMENRNKTQQELNERTLDLSLGLKRLDDESKSKT